MLEADVVFALRSILWKKPDPSPQRKPFLKFELNQLAREGASRETKAHITMRSNGRDQKFNNDLHAWARDTILGKMLMTHATQAVCSACRNLR